MFINYLKIALRNIRKYKIFSFINIFGLAVAMTVCMLLILMLADQSSYDRFHEKKDRIYRILTLRQGSSKPNASTPFPLADVLETEYPFIREATHLVMGVGGDAEYNNNRMEARGYFAEPAFFNVFDFDLQKGDKSTALKAPNSLIITSSFARLLFGNENPMGKSIEFYDRGLNIIKMEFVGKDSSPVDWGSFTITGVINDQNYKSHLKFDVLISASSLQTQSLYTKTDIHKIRDDWQSYSRCYSYVVLNRESDANNLTKALSDLAIRKYAGIEDFKGFRFIAQKLTDITPGEFVGNPPSLRLPVEIYYFLGFLAFVIIILACLNYTGLSVARLLTRAKEIGVRRVTGARRKNIFFQFLIESVFTALIAMIMAILLLVLLKSGFKSLWLNRYLNFDLQESLQVYLIFGGFAIITGLIAGIFPAFSLAKFLPVRMLNNPENKGSGKLTLRKILGISQFAVSLFFIITAFLIHNQVNHLLRFHYGFSSENIVNIQLQGNDYKQVASEMNVVPGVVKISGCAFIPATGMYNGSGLKSINSDKPVGIEYLAADANFVDNLDLKIVAGRNLPLIGENTDRSILINETAARKLGYENPAQIVGQTFLFQGNPHDAVEVIGVMKDFHFQSAMLTDKISPFMLRNKESEFSYINVKIIPGGLKDTIEKLRNKWKDLDPVHPFKYYFFDQQIASVNQVLGDVLSILGFIAFLAITIACLGLLGMVTLTTERRRKEIGIRKVLGAAGAGIVFLLSKEFLRMLLISVVIAAPLSYIVNSAWLQNFPNRVDFGIDTIFMGTVILLFLGLLTVSTQTFRAARSNPVESLRYE